MSVLSHYKNVEGYERTQGLLANKYSPLPVVFIPHYVVEKLKAYNLNYQDVFGKLGYEHTRRYDCEITKSRVSDFMKVVGSKEAFAIEALNRKMFSTGGNYSQCIQSFINFSLSESDYRKEINNMTEQLSKIDNCKPYHIENNTDCFFIIMNNNSFTSFSDTYRNMSKELCDKLLDFIDESFVYQSCFFKSL